MIYLSKNIKNISNLQVLNIKSKIYYNIYNNVGDDGLIEFCNNLQYITKLSELNISGIYKYK